MKKIQAVLFAFMMLVMSLVMPSEVCADDEKEQAGNAGQENTEAQPAVEVSAPSAILMEASTGTVIFEKDADTARPPASVTKVMTMLLIFDAIENGSISLEDEVTVSEHAASMGGSQVFLEPGETQTVDTMLKCISVASANDACVAMAEYICGNEEEFVARMNERARELGMDNTTFVNCNGLDTDGHVTSARDIALMSRELITKYPQVHDYSMIWMENITHETNKGTSEFGLTNTNKLVRQYEYATGLKTGSTGDAKFCVSATAEKNGIELIAVVMAAENSKDRFADAVKLLNYGFGKCQLYTDESTEGISPVTVENGVEDTIDAVRAESFSYLDTSGGNINGIERSVQLNTPISAPVSKGDVLGYIVYTLDGKEIGKSGIIAGEDMKKATYLDHLGDIVREVFL
ncbi:MAG TPA: D-alanyl-D-alanine carboxypeptidase [Candidatus Mediterraneibacter pullistercoris]|nr:D-alanyl-D-alanine carboxypeptidase [Candidatus Mediterraneibacter pullistercoris]